MRPIVHTMHACNQANLNIRLPSRNHEMHHSDRKPVRTHVFPFRLQALAGQYSVAVRRFAGSLLADYWSVLEERSDCFALTRRNFLRPGRAAFLTFVGAFLGLLIPSAITSYSFQDHSDEAHVRICLSK